MLTMATFGLPTGIMLAHPDPGLEKRLPRSLEGYPVAIEVTGVIHPLH